MIRVFLFLLLNLFLEGVVLAQSTRCSVATYCQECVRISEPCQWCSEGKCESIAPGSAGRACSGVASSGVTQVCKGAWNCDATAMICTQGPPGGYGERQDVCIAKCKPNDPSSPQKGPAPTVVHPTISSDIVVVSIVFACLSMAFFVGFIIFRLKRSDPYVPFACSCSYCMGLFWCLVMLICGTTWTLIFCLGKVRDGPGFVVLGAVTATASVLGCCFTPYLIIGACTREGIEIFFTLCACGAVAVGALIGVIFGIIWLVTPSDSGAGATAAALLGTAIIFVVLFCCCKRVNKKSSVTPEEQTPDPGIAEAYRQKRQAEEDEERKEKMEEREEEAKQKYEAEHGGGTWYQAREAWLQSERRSGCCLL